MADEYFLVFANSDYTLDLSRFLRTESTDGWNFFQGRENIGTMLIVNQTIPRALRRLGYDDAQVDASVRHIDEHKSIVGAPVF